MRIRVVFSGVAAAAICVTALWFPWFMMIPAELATDWPYLEEAAMLPDWMPIGVFALCGLTLFVFGWVSARWNWAKDWKESLLAGAGMGLLAGCLIYDFIGVFHFGLLGQKEILVNFNQELNLDRGLAILIDSLTNTATSIYINFLLLCAGCVLAGALGGLASAVDLSDRWGASPRTPDSWLFRLPAFSLTLTGTAVMIVVVASFSVLQETIIEAVAREETKGITTLPYFITFVVYLVSWVSVVLPAAFTWGWLLSSWKTAGVWRVTYVIWMLISLSLAGWVTFYFLGLVQLFYFMGSITTWLVYILPAVLLTLCGGIWMGHLSKPVADGVEKYHFSDWVGYILTQGAFGGTQLFVTMMAYFLAVVSIAITNIPHLADTGVVEKMPTQQVAELSSTLTGFAEFAFVVGAVGGWVLGLVVLVVRKFLKIKVVPPSQSVATSESGF